jgi:hypothetical protein
MAHFGWSRNGDGPADQWGSIVMYPRFMSGSAGASPSAYAPVRSILDADAQFLR